MRMQITYNGAELRAELRRKPREVLTAVDRKLGRGAQEVARDARRLAPKGTSLLTNAIHVLRHGRADYEIFAATDYAALVEKPTDPAQRTEDPTRYRRSILDWIKVKHLTPRDPDMDLDDLAYVIGRAIHQRGTAAQPFMGAALDKNRSRLAELMRQGMAEGLR